MQSISQTLRRSKLNFTILGNEFQLFLSSAQVESLFHQVLLKRSIGCGRFVTIRFELFDISRRQLGCQKLLAFEFEFRANPDDNHLVQDPKDLVDAIGLDFFGCRIQAYHVPSVCRAGARHQ